MSTTTTQATTPWLICRPYIAGIAWTCHEVTARQAAQALQESPRRVRVMLGTPEIKETKETQE